VQEVHAAGKVERHYWTAQCHIPEDFNLTVHYCRRCRFPPLILQLGNQLAIHESTNSRFYHM